MTTQLTTLDLIVMGVYFLLILTIGIVSSRKRSLEEFLIADRKLNAFTDMATIIAAKTGAGLLVTFTALVYLYGVSAFWFFAGASSGYIVFIFFAVHLRKLSSEKRFYTLPDYFFYRFGKVAGLFSAVMILVYMTLALLLQLIGGAKILNDVFGISYMNALIVIGATILSYMLLGGFMAVVKTDIVQFLAIIILMGLLAYTLVHENLDALRQSATAHLSPSPKSILSFFLIGILMPFASMELWQRVYAAKDVKTVRRSLILSAISYLFIGVLLLLIGLVIAAKVRNIDPDLALVQGFRTLLPPGFVGIAVVTFLAAILSSADSYLFANVSIVLQDFYLRLRPIIPKEKLVLFFRVALILLFLFNFLLALRFRSVVAITFYGVSIGSVIATCGILSWCFRRLKSRTLIPGMTLGFAGTLFFAITGEASESLTLKSIALTLTGVAIGKVFELFTQPKPRVTSGS